jgi:hypothetical protein
LGRSSSSGRRILVWLDRIAVGGLALGLCAYALPVAVEGRLKLAFWVTLGATLLHIYTSARGPTR